MKKRIIIIMSMFIMLCSLTACNEKSKSLNEIMGNIDIVSIDIINGKNGNIVTYTDGNVITEIKEYMQQVKCIKNNPEAATGWEYRFQIRSSDGNMTDITFAGSNSSIDNEKYNMEYQNLQEFVKGLK